MNRVHAALPIVHQPEGKIFLNGKMILNTWKDSTLKPSSEERPMDPKIDFPFIHKLWFEDGFDPHEQLDFFLAWLRRWYISALKFQPCRGQVLVICGPPGSGKSFSSQIVLGGIFGGFQDASDFFVNQENFNGHMFESALWCVDDAMVGTSEEKRLFYASVLKKISADSKFSFKEKFRKGAMAEWNGRVVITCNDDPESLSVIPQMSVSNDDKIMLLKIGNNSAKFDDVNAELAVKEELPKFLKWLIDDWQIPSHVKGDARYGVKAYKHEELNEEAHNANDLHGVDEIIYVYLAEWFSTLEDQSIDKIELKATELLERLQGEGSPVRAASRNLTLFKLGRELKNMSSSTRAKLKFQRVMVHGIRLFRFNKKDFVNS